METNDIGSYHCLSSPGKAPQLTLSRWPQEMTYNLNMATGINMGMNKWPEGAQICIHLQVCFLAAPNRQKNLSWCWS